MPTSLGEPTRRQPRRTPRRRSSCRRPGTRSARPDLRRRAPAASPRVGRPAPRRPSRSRRAAPGAPAAASSAVAELDAAAARRASAAGSRSLDELGERRRDRGGGAGTAASRPRAAELVPRRGRRRASTSRNGGIATRNAEPGRQRDRLDDLAPPAHPRRAAVQAERHVGPDLGARARARRRRRCRRRAAAAPRAARRRRRPSRRRARRPRGSACAARAARRDRTDPPRTISFSAAMNARLRWSVGTSSPSRRTDLDLHAARVRAPRTPRARRGAGRARRRAPRGRGSRRRDGRAPAATA